MGERFGHYLLQERLGAGGVGEVWRAHDTVLDRVVAVKLLLGRFRGDAAATARFHREAQMAARLRHRNIVRVHTFGEIDQRLYLDMELIDGPNLGTVLEGSRMGRDRALCIVEEVARALDAAHALDRPEAARMVHRDVKPANVLLEPGGTGEPEHVYLADFGVARAVLPGTSITREGEIHGTPDYMAPELWNRGRSDHRVDVYSLAVMLFQAATGELPFPRPTLESTVAAHLLEPVPVPSDLDRDLPREFDEVIARGMAKDPGERFARAGELAAAARAALERRSPGLAMAPRDSGTIESPAPTRPDPVSVPTRPTPPPDPLPTLPAPAAPRPAPAPPPQGTSPSSDEVLRPPRARPAEPAVRPDEPVPPYLASRAHFAGLAGTALLVPLHLVDLVDVGWLMVVYAVLLYGLGALLVAVLRPR